MEDILFHKKNEVSSDDAEDDDAWDDSVLIDAYDKAVGLAMKEVQRRMEQGAAQSDLGKGAKKKNKKKGGSSKSAERSQNVPSNENPKWKVGMPCQAIYEEDGDLYEAIIKTLSLEDETCTVQFIGYNNIQTVALDNLHKTQGSAAIRKQMEKFMLAQESEAQAAAMEWTSVDPGVPSFNAPKTKIKREQLSATQADNSHMNGHFPIDASIHMAIPPPPPITQFTAHLPADEAEALSSMCMSWYLNGFHTGYYLGLKQGQQPK